MYSYFHWRWVSHNFTLHPEEAQNIKLLETSRFFAIRIWCSHRESECANPMATYTEPVLGQKQNPTLSTCAMQMMHAQKKTREYESKKLTQFPRLQKSRTRICVRVSLIPCIENYLNNQKKWLFSATTSSPWLQCTCFTSCYLKVMHKRCNSTV